MRKTLFLLFALCLMLVSCSKIEVVEFDAQTYKDGLLFYRPVPYLMVTESAENKLTSTIVWLPDINQKYVLRSTGWWGSSELSAKLQDGWNLIEIGAKRDSKIPETITSIAGVISAKPMERKDIKPMEKKTEKLTPGLYRFEFNKDGQVQSIQPVTLQLPN